MLENRVFGQAGGGDINGQNKKSFVKENHCFVYDN